MITKDLLLIAGIKILYIINVDQHSLVRVSKVPDSGPIYASCMVNKNILLTGDKNHKIKQWK